MSSALRTAPLPTSRRTARHLIVSSGLSVALVLAIFGLFWAISTFLFQRPTVAMALLFMTIGGLLTCALIYAALNGWRTGIVAALVAGLFSVVVALQMPAARLLPWAAQAQNNLNLAAQTLGTPSPLQPELNALLADRNALVSNPLYLSRLSDLAHAQADPAQVLTYLVAAQSIGLDASSVTANGLVRPSDLARLEQAMAQQLATP